MKWFKQRVTRDEFETWTAFAGGCGLLALVCWHTDYEAARGFARGLVFGVLAAQLLYAARWAISRKAVQSGLTGAEKSE